MAVRDSTVLRPKLLYFTTYAMQTKLVGNDASDWTSSLQLQLPPFAPEISII